MSLSVDVRKKLGGFSLDARFETGPGITALFGRSGSGKSTLIGLVAGLIRPDEGRIALEGEALVDTGRRLFVPAHRRRIGIVFQEGRLFPHMTVRQNLIYGWRLAPRAARWGALDPIVDLLGIAPLLPRRPATLSGGEKQRVAIGRALLSGPRCLLLDEPLAALDAERKAEILPYIERLRDEMRLPIVYVSHAVDEVARLADTVVRIDAGRIVAVGSVADVFVGLDEGIAAETGAVLTATVEAHDAASGLTRLAHPAGPILVPLMERPVGAAVRLRIRARDITVAVGPVGRLSVRNRLAATVAEIRLGTPPDATVRLDVAGGPMVARLTQDAVRELGLVPGVAVTALIKAVAVDDLRPGRRP